MTTDEKVKCNAIIHTHAAAAGAANAGIPIPGVGIIPDLIAFTSMTVQLARVFGRKVSKAAAKGIAIACLKKYLLRAPLRAIGKLIPFVRKSHAKTQSRKAPHDGDKTQRE